MAMGRVLSARIAPPAPRPRGGIFTQRLNGSGSPRRRRQQIPWHMVSPVPGNADFLPSPSWPMRRDGDGRKSIPQLNNSSRRTGRKDTGNHAFLICPPRFCFSRCRPKGGLPAAGGRGVTPETQTPSGHAAFHGGPQFQRPVPPRRSSAPDPP